MVADLRGDDVGLGELGFGAAQLLLQLLEKGWIQINGPVCGTTANRWRMGELDAKCT
jgi:hypothetical protein